MTKMNFPKGRQEEMSKDFNKLFGQDRPEFAKGGVIEDENLQVSVEEDEPEMQHAEVPEETPEPENDSTNSEDADNIDDGLKSRHVGGSDYVYQGNF